MKSYRFRTLVCAIATALSIGLFSCTGDNAFVTQEGVIWNTTYHITYRGSQTLADSITNTLNAVGQSINAFDSTSNLSRINKGMTTEADCNLVRVIKCAKEIHNHSKGSFDPTLGPVIRAWGFGKGHRATADTARLDSLRHFVGFDKWILKGTRVRKTDERIELNLSGIAKGYGCDAVAEMLIRNGVKDFMVEIGGEIRMGGKSPHGGDWTIAIDKPEVSNTANHEFLTTISITDCGMATSGDYRNYQTDSKGNRYGHTLDPITMMPVHTDVLSATVIAQSAMEADGYATACMVLGVKRALRMADKYNLAILLVTDAGIEISDSMRKILDKSQQ